MFSKALLFALAATPFVAAHGKVAVMGGNLGGNTTGLGIQGGVVPGPGKNAVTEVDTTVFKSKAAATDGLGKTKAGPNTLAGMSAVMAQSGSTLPQVTQDGGSVNGTVHIVTTDGAGPYKAICDATGTGAFSTGQEMVVDTNLPGRRGNIAAPKQRRFMTRMLVNMGIVKRASNVNEDYPFKATMPAGVKCAGTVAGQSNVCLIKIVNPSNAGPFGGVIAVQQVQAGGAAGGAAGAAAGAAAGNGTAATGAAGAAPATGAAGAAPATGAAGAAPASPSFS